MARRKKAKPTSEHAAGPLGHRGPEVPLHEEERAAALPNEAVDDGLTCSDLLFLDRIFRCGVLCSPELNFKAKALSYRALLEHLTVLI